MMFKEQAETCRKQACEFAGRPEAPFLLRVASAFDDLALGNEASLVRSLPVAAGRLPDGPPRISA